MPGMEVGYLHGRLIRTCSNQHILDLPGSCQLWARL